MITVAASDQPPQVGRSCPRHYRYSPEVFRAPPALVADTLYVVGGLYGNPPAVDARMHRTARESGDVRVIFNGDFHRLDTDPADLTPIHQAAVNAHANPRKRRDAACGRR